MKTMKQRSQSKVKRGLASKKSIEKTGGVVANPGQDCSLRAAYNVCENK